VEHHRKARPLIGLALDIQFAAQSMRDSLRDCQAKSRAADSAPPRCHGAEERLEHARQIIGFDSLTAVFDAESDFVFVRPKAYNDRRARLAVTKRIIQQVVDSLREQTGMSGNPQRFGAFAFQTQIGKARVRGPSGDLVGNPLTEIKSLQKRRRRIRFFASQKK
jgi:hypothetical protein